MRPSNPGVRVATVLPRGNLTAGGATTAAGTLDAALVIATVARKAGGAIVDVISGGRYGDRDAAAGHAFVPQG